jgi:hypothetical protein
VAASEDRVAAAFGDALIAPLARNCVRLDAGHLAADGCDDCGRSHGPYDAPWGGVDDDDDPWGEVDDDDDQWGEVDDDDSWVEVEVDDDDDEVDDDDDQWDEVNSDDDPLDCW